MKIILSAVSLAFILVAAQPALAELLDGEKEAIVTAIPGVIAGDAAWHRAWASEQTADGIVGTPDGGLVFAQERTDTIWKLDADDTPSVYMKDTHGAGAVALDNEGRLYAAERTCTAPDRIESKACKEPTKISIVMPAQQVLADQLPDGKTLGRLNDIVSDGKGGAYFTAAGAYFVSPQGQVEVVADTDIRPNGIMLNRKGDVLYVTNRDEVLAFNVTRHGVASDRRVFAKLAGETGADGMAIDSAGRVYVTGNAGIHVLTPEGQELGLIPVPRRPVSLAFTGPGKKVLYAATFGATGEDGKDMKAPEGQRNNAMTLYKIDMLSEGFAGRPK